MKFPIRILTVDGGGVGGILPARILQRLHALDSRVVDNADIVAGTSTGGLIALGLAAGVTPTALCTLYLERAKDIFSRANRRYLAVRALKAKFSPDGLRDAVTAIVGDRTLGELAVKSVLVPVTAVRRADGRHRPAGVFLSTAFRLTGDKKHEKYGSSRWRCVDVALATAAAPTYFPAHEVADPSGSNTSWLCWDGGIVANNPALAALGEVLRLDLAVRGSEVRADTERTPDIRILSLGTGYRNITIEAGDWGLVQTARPVVSALMDTSVGSTAFLLRQMLGNRVIRVSPELAADYDMDDANAVTRLDDVASDFVNTRLNSIRQPDGTTQSLTKWLTEYWYR